MVGPKGLDVVAVALLLRGVLLPLSPGTVAMDVSTLYPSGQIMDMTYSPASLEAFGLVDVNVSISDNRAGGVASVTVHFTTRFIVPSDAQLLL